MGVKYRKVGDNIDINEVRTNMKDRGYVLLSNRYKTNKDYLIFEKDGYLYYNTYNGFVKTDNFQKWNNRNPYSEYNMNLYILRDGGKCRVIEYHTSSDIEMRCQCGAIYRVSVNNLFKRGRKQYQCPQCGREQGAKNHQKEDEYIAVLKDKGLSLISEYAGCKKTSYYKTVDGYYAMSSLYNVKHGVNIADSMFDRRNIYAMDNVKNWINKHYENTDIISDKFIGVKSKYLFKCKKCAHIFERNLSHVMMGSSLLDCPICNKNISHGELVVIDWLNMNHIAYEQQKMFNGCQNKNLLKFDFYIHNFNCCIEVDGEQHYIPVRFGGMDIDRANREFESAKIRDSIKDEYCKKHNINLIRISYIQIKNDEYKTILNSIFHS